MSNFVRMALLLEDAARMLRLADEQLNHVNPQDLASLEGYGQLSVRARNGLSGRYSPGDAITTVADLCSRTPEDLRGRRNFGMAALNEVRAWLGKHGLRLTNDGGQSPIP